MSGNKNSAPFSDLERHALIEAIRHEFDKNLDLSKIEDAVEEGMEKTALAMQVQVIENPNGYAHMASRHAALKIIRRKKHEGSITELPSEPDAEDHAEKSYEAVDFVNKVLERMPAAWAEELRLSSEGYTATEIAEKMGRTVKAIRRIKEKAEERFYKIGIKLGMTGGGGGEINDTKIIRKILRNRRGISRGVWPYTASASFYAPRAIRSTEIAENPIKSRQTIKRS